MGWTFSACDHRVDTTKCAQYNQIVQCTNLCMRKQKKNSYQLYSIVIKLTLHIWWNAFSALFFKYPSSFSENELWECRWQLSHFVQLQFKSISNSHSLLIVQKKKQKMKKRLHSHAWWWLCERVQLLWFWIENGINTLCDDFHLVIKTPIEITLEFYIPFDSFSVCRMKNCES